MWALLIMLSQSMDIKEIKTKVVRVTTDLIDTYKARTLIST
jgi:hypothetical protein